MSNRMRWIIILTALGILVGLRIWDWWAGSPDHAAGRVQVLEEQAQDLRRIAQDARQDADQARADLVTASEKLAAERLLRERERASLAARARKLETQLATLRARIEAPPELVLPELSDVELAGRAVLALSAFVPAARPPRVEPDGSGGFVADRSAISAAVACTERMAWCREALDVGDRQVAALEAALNLEKQEVAGWKHQARICQESEQACRAALETAARLEAHQLQLLEARAAQAKTLERKLRIARVERWGWIAGAGVAGYLIGRP